MNKGMWNNQKAGAALVAALAVMVSVSVGRATLITFDPPDYPADVSGAPALEGIDGWTDAGANDWVLWTGGYDGSHVAFNNAGNGVNAGALSRTFAEALTEGTLNYQVRPNLGSTGHWLLPMDSTGSTLMLQLLAEPANQGQGSTDNQFRLVSAGGPQYSPDSATIDFAASAWYKVNIDFNLADTSGGPNGTFDLTITRLDTSTVVWNVTGAGVVGSMANVGLFRDNGSVGTTGFATLLDNIAFQGIPEPSTAALLLLGGGLTLWRRRSRKME